MERAPPALFSARALGDDGGVQKAGAKNILIIVDGSTLFRLDAGMVKVTDDRAAWTALRDEIEPWLNRPAPPGDAAKVDGRAKFDEVASAPVSRNSLRVLSHEDRGATESAGKSVTDFHPIRRTKNGRLDDGNAKRHALLGHFRALEFHGVIVRLFAVGRNLFRRERRHDFATAHGPADPSFLCVGGRTSAAVFRGGFAAALIFSLTGCGSLSVKTAADTTGAEVTARLDYAKLGEEIRAAVQQVEAAKKGGAN